MRSQRDKLPDEERISFGGVEDAPARLLVHVAREFRCVLGRQWFERNGFGKVISCEFDPVVYARAKERLEDSPLKPWIELRNQSSLEMKIDGTIDLFFSDSDMPIREQEVKRFLPQINPNGLILMHDASSHHKVVRDAAKSMESEGLLSVVFLPTPRGLAIAQPRAGRS